MSAEKDRFVVLYRWKIKVGCEDEFARAWLEVTDHFRAEFGSLGSRLHKGNDGIFYAYAMWPSAEMRDAALFDESLAEAAKKMREAAEERFPEVILEIVADRIK